MAGFTNKGIFNMMNVYLRAAAAPTNFYLALVTSAVAPAPDINTFSELTEIPAGNGYTAGGLQIDRNSTEWDVLTEDDANDQVVAQLIDETFTASGGYLPSTGGARYAVLTDDNVTPASREIIAWWDLGADRQVSDGQDLTLQNLELRGQQAA